MPFITEQLLEEAALALNDSEMVYEQAVAALQDKQPILFAYFFTENFQALTPQERDYLFYLLLVVWEAMGRAGVSAPRITEQQLSTAEEYNWGILEQSRAKGFHQRLDPFFQGYPQEDLLAFAEDALAEDEEGQATTTEGREAMFISLKTAIDCLAQVPLPDARP